MTDFQLANLPVTARLRSAHINPGGAILASVAFYNGNAAPIFTHNCNWSDVTQRGIAAKLLSDHLGPTIDLKVIIASLTEFEQALAEDTESKAPGSESLLPIDAAWPAPIEGPAMHGFLGEIVHWLSEHTEADPIAMLVNLLIGSGVLIGRGPKLPIGAGYHWPRTNALLIGVSARGRKGESMVGPKRLFEQVDAEWASYRITEGLSSGEGLVSLVRDPYIVKKKNDKGIEVEVTEDAGEPDKRLLIVEPEFSRTLRAARREGSTLSALIRAGWDGGNLSILTKRRITATAPHIAILGHCTTEELRTEAKETDFVNGLLNRFLIVAVQRARRMPDPPKLNAERVHYYGSEIYRRIQSAQRNDEMSRTPGAAALWEHVYDALTNDSVGGLIGAMTARAEAHTARLSLLYACLNGHVAIEESDLRSALDLWDYCERSARYVFGGSTGNLIADSIATKLRKDGPLTRTAIRDLFNRHAKQTEIDAALGSLMKAGQVTQSLVKGNGRPVETWEWVAQP